VTRHSVVKDSIAHYSGMVFGNDRCGLAVFGASGDLTKRKGDPGCLSTERVLFAYGTTGVTTLDCLTRWGFTPAECAKFALQILAKDKNSRNPQNQWNAERRCFDNENGETVATSSPKPEPVLSVRNQQVTGSIPVPSTKPSLLSRT
jgi:hypothetical protein